MATSSGDATAAESAAPSATAPISIWYMPRADKMREALENKQCGSFEDRKMLLDELLVFDFVHDELLNLMRERGFFGSFTQAQKLWYIDATLYDAYCSHYSQRHEKYPFPCPSGRPQLQAPQNPLLATSSVISTGRTNNGFSTRRSLGANPRNTSPLSRQNDCTETDVALVDGPGGPSNSSPRSSPQKSDTQVEDSSERESAANGNTQSEHAMSSTSQSLGNTQVNSFQGARPFNLNIGDSSIIKRRRATAGSIVRSGDDMNSTSNSRAPTSLPNTQQVSIPEIKNVNKEQMQLGQSATAQRKSTPLTTNQPNHNRNPSGRPTMAQYPPDVLQQPVARGPFNASFPPQSISRHRNMQGYGNQVNTPPMSRQGSKSEHGSNHSGSPVVGQNPYLQNGTYNSPQTSMPDRMATRSAGMAATMGARPQSQSGVQQNNTFQGREGQGGHPPPQGSKLRAGTNSTVTDQGQQQPTHNRSFSDCTTKPGGPQRKPPQQYFMGIPTHGPSQGSPVRPVQSNFRPTSAPNVPAQNSPPQGRNHGHSIPRPIHQPGRARNRANGPVGFSPMHRQYGQVQYGVSVSRTNSAPPGHVQRENEMYLTKGHGTPAADLQGGYPMTRGNGSATNMPQVSRPLILPQDQALVESRIRGKRKLNEFSGDSLDHSPNKG